MPNLSGSEFSFYTEEMPSYAVAIALVSVGVIAAIFFSLFDKNWHDTDPTLKYIGDNIGYLLVVRSVLKVSNPLISAFWG